MRALEDSPERQALLTKMRDIAVEDAPWIYINHDENLSLYYDWLTNVKSHPIANDTAQYRSVMPNGALTDSRRGINRTSCRWPRSRVCSSRARYSPCPSCGGQNRRVRRKLEADQVRDVHDASSAERTGTTEKVPKRAPKLLSYP
jgi:hypothetical protein